MRHSTAAAVTVIAALLLTGCSTSAGTTTPATTPAASTPAEPTPAEPVRSQVPWEDYDATVKTRIDDATEAGDCVLLQAEFDTADANNAATMNRTGHNNADLMVYIGEALELAGCYN